MVRVHSCQLEKFWQGEFMKNSTKAVLITGARTGGTFLSTCFSNHPDIFWVREEVFNGSSVYASLPDDEAILYQVYRQRFYKLNGFKTLFAELDTKRLESILSWKPRIIFLLRRNILEQVISGLIMNRVKTTEELPIHSFDAVDQSVTFHIDPEALISGVKRVEVGYLQYLDWINEKAYTYDLPTLTLYYEDLYTPENITNLSGITYIKQNEEWKILDFLGVDEEYPLFSGTIKISKNPFQRIENYDEVYSLIEQTKYREFWEKV